MTLQNGIAARREREQDAQERVQDKMRKETRLASERQRMKARHETAGVDHHFLVSGPPDCRARDACIFSTELPNLDRMHQTWISRARHNSPFFCNV